MNENHLKDSFLKFYDEKVRPLAVKCSKGYYTMVAIERGETVSNEDMDFIKNHKDTNAIWFIGLFIGDVDYYRIKGIRLNLINSLSMVQGCLNSESYWTNVWENDISSEDAQNLKELGKLMTELLRFL